MRRTFLTSLLIGFLALLSSCATLPPPPKTISVTEARLAQLISSQFPFNSEMLEVLDVVVSTPRISLDPLNNRINTALDIDVAGNSILGLFTSKTYKGALDLSYGLRFEPRDATVRLTDVRVHRLDIDGTPSVMRRSIEKLGTPLAQKLLKDYVLYKVRPEDLQAAQGWGYMPGAFKVEATGLSLTLDPVERK
ncbi:MAG: DUF1439 domain-containing protein [Propionivibrio sp.]|nr:DUF1439 domain-containing protein [Propionivibrio sp.]